MTARNRRSAPRAHGTRTKYVHDGCRCLPCRAASSRYESERQRRHGVTGNPYRVRYAAGGWWFVREWTDGIDGEVLLKTRDRHQAYELCAELIAEWRVEYGFDPTWASSVWTSPAKLREVRRHVARCIDAGVGLRRISEVSGVSRSRLQEIARGHARRKGRPSRRALKLETAERILAVPLTVAAGRALVPAAETHRLVDELLAAGVTRKRIGQAVAGSQARALQLSRNRVTAASARAVRALHDAVFIAEERLRTVCKCSDSALRVSA